MSSAPLTSTTPVLAPKFDPTDRFTIEHPYARYMQLRVAGPVCRAFLPGHLAVTHHAPVKALLGDPRLGMEFAGEAFGETDSALRSFFHNIVFEQNPPTHKRLRRFLNSAFSKPFSRQLLERIDARIENVLAPLLERGEFDAVQELAALIPALMVGELLGVPEDGLATFHANAREFHRLAYVELRKFTNVGDARRAENSGRAEELLRWLRAQCAALIAARRRNPAADLTSQLAHLSIDSDMLSDAEILDNMIFLFFAGLDSSCDLISTGFVALAQHPDQWALLKSNPALVPGAVEEFLRYDAPIQALARRVLGTIEVAGRTLRPPRVLWLLLGSANHDERVFESPERLLVTRSPNPHVAFGAGMHSCMSAHFARSAAAMIFRRCVARCSMIELRAEPIRRHSVESRSYEQILLRARLA